MKYFTITILVLIGIFVIGTLAQKYYQNYNLAKDIYTVTEDFSDIGWDLPKKNP